MNAALLLVFLFIPDLGAVLIMGLTGLIIGIYAGISVKNILTMLVVAGTGLMTVVWWLLSFSNNYCINVPREERSSLCSYTYIARRLEVYINPDSDSTGLGTSWQGRNALIAIGGGWFLWNGYGKGLQKFWYIPQAQSDFIFAAFAEEVWFVGISILFGLYFGLLILVAIKLQYVRDPFFKNIAVWLLSLILIGVFVHIGVNTQLLPNTWLTLPFVSHGSTSLLANSICIVLLYKILYKEAHKVY